MKTSEKTRYVRQARARAADDVCSTLLMMMGLGLLEIPLENRGLLSGPMQTWVKEAVVDGDVKSDDGEDGG